MKKKPVPIIDLFAGPGGLGEGFTSVTDKENNRFFKIALSIERDEFAHKTLTLRSFLRQFPNKKFPPEYYQYIRSEIKNIEDLYNKYPQQSAEAKKEAWKFSLGNPEDHEKIDERIRESLKGEKNFVLIGGPPCQAYSLVGRARRQEKEGLNKEDERVYLYREYYRILAVHQPSVFIMENVKGLLSSKVEKESIFNQLLNDLKNPVESYRKLHGKYKLPESKHSYKIYSLVQEAHSANLFGEEYEPSDFIIRTELYGIPQTRHRVILLGVRDDIIQKPALLKKANKPITVKDVIETLPKIRSGLSKQLDNKYEWKKSISELTELNLKKEIDQEVWLKMLQEILNLKAPQKDKGALFLESDVTIGYKSEWFLDKKLKGVCNHESRSHIKEDLWRYLFVSCFGKIKGRSPKLTEFPFRLLPKHRNAISGDFANRFKSQLWHEPARTITSHISKDGHYFIHPDSGQCRSLTVREAARIQTFPDNYFFCGPRTQQFHQVGNAVPPLLAKQVAEIVKTLF
jgi:DNA (cytosine-5)-methyltransferase 1